MSVRELERRGRERDVRRQLLMLRLEHALPPLFVELAKMLASAILGYWVLAWLVALAGGPRSEYSFAVVGLVFALQATYYKLRLARDPGYEIPKCACAGRSRDDSEEVLRSRFSSMLGVPNSALAAVAYGAIFVFVWFGLTHAALVVAAVAVAAGGYLAFVMVTRINGLCATCVNMAALSGLLLVQLLT